MTSYEKTRKQYAGSKEHQERCKFEAGLKWYMETKESTIRRIVPGFDGLIKIIEQILVIYNMKMNI